MGATRWMTSVVVAAAVCSTIVAGAQEPADSRRLPSPAGTGGRRVALVVGNDTYPSMPLRNARNDARAVGAALHEIGFEVEVAEDLAGAGLERAVRGFVGKLASAEVGFFFYAGHGIAIEGENYLVPVDLDAQDEIEAKYGAFRADVLRERMERSGSRVNVIVLDACRDNPFRFTRSGGRGLGAMNAGRGTLIAMATGPGQTASDNASSRNGLFTEKLLPALRTPGLKLQEVFERAKAAVAEASGQQQRPWVHSDLIGDYYLVPASAGAAAALGPGSGGPAVPAAVPAAPAAPSGDGLDLADLEKAAAARKTWDGWQERMASDFAKAQQFEGQAGQGADLKAAAWERFLAAYATDNPYSSGDEGLRQQAQTQLAKWQAEARRVAAEALQGASPPPSVAPPHLGSPRVPPSLPGQWQGAIAQFRARDWERAGLEFKTVARSARRSWTVQILVVCATATLEKTAAAVPDTALWILPVRYQKHDCYRLLWGLFPEESSAASDGVGSVPQYFRAGGAIPKAIPVSTALP